MRLVAWIVCVSWMLGCGGDDRRGSSDGGALDGAPHDAPARLDVELPDAPTATCETVSATAEALPPTLVFQIDTSNSMNCRISEPSCLTAAPSAGETRWNVFRTVFLDALESLPDTTRVGLMRFPRADGACSNDELAAPIVELGGGRAALRATIEGLVADGLSTPTHDAVLHGYNRLRADMGPRPYLVLITDGDARMCIGCNSCANQAGDNEVMVSAVGAAAAEIPTFVIGVPGAQGFRTILSRMARAAGTERPGCSDGGPSYCHFDLTDPGLDFAVALGDALASIGDAVISCEYDIPPNPDGTFDPGQVNVEIREGGEPSRVPRDPTRTNGWDYDDAMERVLLHGAACERARGAERVDVLFGCPTVFI
ncbi:MAG: VWA domain-containing protein [Myxococcales bacterium]|nr:VWA domain-containing protein [Myxococcales bacterium]